MDNLFDKKINHIEKGCEIFETLFQKSNIKIEKILSNELVEGEWYEQDNDEWVVLLQGNAVLEYEESSQELKAGDYLYIPKLKKHRVLKTSNDAMWLAVHIS